MSYLVKLIQTLRWFSILIQTRRSFSSCWLYGSRIFQCKNLSSPLTKTFKNNENIIVFVRWCIIHYHLLKLDIWFGYTAYNLILIVRWRDRIFKFDSECKFFHVVNLEVKKIHKKFLVSHSSNKFNILQDLTARTINRQHSEMFTRQLHLYSRKRYTKYWRFYFCSPLGSRQSQVFEEKKFP